MKKFYIMFSALVMTSASWAVSAASVAACATGTATAVTAASTPLFVKSNFTPKCSANTHVYFEEDADSAAVASTSVKGSEFFSGHTNGGAVTKAGTCSGTCGTSNLATPLAAALTASS